jgi:hypothetical protein
VILYFPSMASMVPLVPEYVYAFIRIKMVVESNMIIPSLVVCHYGETKMFSLLVVYSFLTKHWSPMIYGTVVIWLGFSWQNINVSTYIRFLMGSLIKNQRRIVCW